MNTYDDEPEVDSYAMAEKHPHKKGHHHKHQKKNKKKSGQPETPVDKKALMMEEGKDKMQMRNKFLAEGGLNIGTNNAFLVFKRANALASKPTNIIQTWAVR